MSRAHGQHGPAASLNRTAFAATWHCLTGCAIGEVLGLVIATAFGLGQRSVDRDRRRSRLLLRIRPDDAPAAHGRRAASSGGAVALAADTVSIAVMEIVDNGFVLLVPGAMEAGLDDFLFWWSLGLACSSPSGRLSRSTAHLIARGRGHAGRARPHVGDSQARPRQEAASRSPGPAVGCGEAYSLARTGPPCSRPGSVEHDLSRTG